MSASCANISVRAYKQHTLVTAGSVQAYIFSQSSSTRYEGYCSKERERDKITQINIQELSSSTFRVFVCLHKQFKCERVLQI